MDAPTGRVIRVLRASGATGPEEQLGDVCVSSNGSLVAAYFADGRFTCFDLNTGEPLFQGDSPPGAGGAVAFSADSEWLYVGMNDGSVARFAAVSGRELDRFAAHPDSVTDIIVDRSGDTLYTSAANGMIRRWRSSDYELIREFVGHEDAVTCLALGPDESELVSGSVDATARLWNVDTGEVLQVFRGHRRTVSGVAFHPAPDQHRIATTGWDGTTRLWDTTTGVQLFGLDIGPWGHDVAFSPDGTQLAWGDSAARLHILDELPERERVPSALFEGARKSVEAKRIVDRLFDESKDLQAVIDSIESDSAISPAIASRAKQLAASYTMDPWFLEQQSLAIVASSARPLREYQRAKRWSTLAVRRGTRYHRPQCQAVSAMAHYRLGEWKDALSVLTAADTSRKALRGTSVADIESVWARGPTETAFLAMTHFQLGDTSRARELLNELERELEYRAEDERREIAALVEEARTLILGGS